MSRRGGSIIISRGCFRGNGYRRYRRVRMIDKAEILRVTLKHRFSFSDFAIHNAECQEPADHAAVGVRIRVGLPCRKRQPYRPSCRASTVHRSRRRSPSALYYLALLRWLLSLRAWAAGSLRWSALSAPAVDFHLPPSPLREPERFTAIMLVPTGIGA